MVVGKTGKLVVPVLAMMVAGSCDSGTGPDGQLRDVQVAFSTTQTGAFGVASHRVFQDDTLTSGTDTVIVTSVGIVVREVELQRVNADDCEVNADACEKFESGPLLVMLPLNGETEVQFSFDIPDGAYAEIELDVHKVSGDDPEDLVFAQQNPDFVDKSIRVEGTFNSTPFLFETDLDVEQELDLNPPLVVDETTGATTITILVDIDGWFRGGDGALVDPNSGNKGQVNEGLIKENIKQSFEAFEDDDVDGKR